MTAPATPTLIEVCRYALRKAGQPAPSNGMIQDTIANQFMDVLNDIKLKAPDHPLLEEEEVLVTTQYVRSLAQPTTANNVKSVMIFDGPSQWRGTATIGTTSTIRMPVGTDLVEADLLGKPIFTLEGTGALQRRTVVSYDNVTTKDVGVSPNYTTAPSFDTTFLIANRQKELLKTSRQILDYNQYQFANNGRPELASINDETIWFDRPPDNVYPLVIRYSKDIDQLDFSSSQFDKILREWRSLIIAGLTAYSMDVYDDERSPNEFSKYFRKLTLLEDDVLETMQSVPYDPVIGWCP